MSFGGKFEDSLVVEQLHKLSVSFLVDDLEIRRGGVAANMCFGLGRLGLSPVLVGCAGDDFADYRSWLERHGVDCDFVRISDTHHTARFVCTTDTTGAQFASFYPGAMSEARLVELAPIVAKVGAPSYVLIGADDPDGMLRHTEECRQRGYPFIADPSQQLAFGAGELIRDLIDGAAFLFSNEYESHMIEQKTGWSADEVLVAGRHPGHHARQGRRPGPAPGRGADRAARRQGRRGARADRRRRRLPRRVPGRPRLGAEPRARGRGGLRARGVRRGDGRPAGLHVHRRAVPRPAGRVVRRRGGRGRPPAPDRAQVTAS